MRRMRSRRNAPQDEGGELDALLSWAHNDREPSFISSHVAWSLSLMLLIWTEHFKHSTVLRPRRLQLIYDEKRLKAAMNPSLKEQFTWKCEPSHPLLPPDDGNRRWRKNSDHLLDVKIRWYAALLTSCFTNVLKTTAASSSIIHTPPLDVGNVSPLHWKTSEFSSFISDHRRLTGCRRSCCSQKPILALSRLMKPRDPKLGWKEVIYTLFRLKTSLCLLS